MRWPPWRAHCRRQSTDASIREAERQLMIAAKQEPRVEQLTARLYARQRENHFAAWVRDAMGGR